jgi:uncharacterized OsmC-like protein
MEEIPMSSEAIRQAMENASEYLRSHRDEARYTDSRATATIVDGLRCVVEGPSGERLETDMPAGVGGGAAAPSPGWFLRAATASCVASLVAMRAAQLGVQLKGIEVDVESRSDDYGILGLDASVPAGPLAARIVIRLRTPDGAGAHSLDELGQWAVDHCPVSDAVRRAVPLDVEVVPSQSV